MKNIKTATVLLAVSFCLTMLFGCAAQDDTPSTPISNKSTPVASSTAEADTTLSPEEIERKENFATSTPENDTDVGLKNIKIDTAEMTLTEEQKMIIEYFDEDYLTVPDYDFLRRYPNVYENAQLKFGGFVKKVLSATSDEYKLVLWLGKSEDLYYYRVMSEIPPYSQYQEENAGNLVIITGKPSDMWFMEDDYLEIYGRYTGIETVEIDGVSYTVPTVTAKKAFISSDLANGVERYDFKYIKTIAEAIFGSDIEVRNPVAETDYDEDLEWRVMDEKPFYIVELENQSNAKFTKYRFYTKTGLIEDAKTGTDFWLLGTDENIRRYIEFSADFEHFFLFTYDTSLEMLTLEYYDSNLQKQWKREFEETTSALYDYTKNNIYLCANNELYIIDISTGEDTFSPLFVGAKTAIRKLEDGVLMIGESKSDALIKSDLSGNMIWKTNLAEDVYRVNGVQIIGEKIILQLELTDGSHFVVVDNTTGQVLADATLPN